MSTRRRCLPLLAAILPLSGLLVAPAWASSTANEVVYASDRSGTSGFYDVLITDPEARTTHTVLAADPSAGISYDHPELSPDGSQVVATQFTLHGSGGETGAIVIASRDGSGLRQLTSPQPTATSDTNDVAPVWSPDGSTILFSRAVATTPTSGPTTFDSSLQTVPAAGGTVAAVPGGSGGFSADYDPSGRRIVFASVSSGADSGPLTVMGVDGSNPTRLGPTGALPAWSPDGATIAYATVTSPDPAGAGADVTQIGTVPATGGSGTVLAVTRPTSARTAAEYPSWAVDGQSILFDLFGYDARGHAQPGAIWAVDPAGTRAGPFLSTAGDLAQPFAQGPAPSPVSAGVPSRYRPVTPVRILDTRDGTGSPAGPVSAKSPLVLTVRGLRTAQGTVPDTATAVILNVTVTDATAATDVRVYPSDAAVPTASNINTSPGHTVPNLVTATLSADGKVALVSSAGTVNLIADLAGWYTPAATGAGFTSLAPQRILDTRQPPVGAPAAGRVPAETPLDLQVTGTLPTADGGTVTVPPDATAVVLNVTGTDATAGTDVRVYPVPADPADTRRPVVSNLNLRPGEATPNLVTVAVGAGGRVRLANAAGAVDLIADLAGYYSARSAGRYVPVVPLRFLDTRTGVGSAATPLGAGQFADLKLAGTRGVPAGALAVVLNVTGTGATAGTDVRAYPTPTTSSGPPTVSNLNLGAGGTRANLAVVRPGADGRVRLRNEGGFVHLISDLAGYFV